MLFIKSKRFKVWFRDLFKMYFGNDLVSIYIVIKKGDSFFGIYSDWFDF